MSRVSHDDVLFGYRLRLFTLAEEIGVRPACRAMGIHHSTYYRWKAKVDRWGLEALRIRKRQAAADAEPDRTAPRAAGDRLQPRPPRLWSAADSSTRREKWGGLRISEHGVWRVLCRYGLNTRNKRLALIAGHADP